MVKYAPIIMGNVATINIHMAKIRPNFPIRPSTFVDAKRTKNPMVVKTVAGIKLKIKHMGFPFFVVKIINLFLSEFSAKLKAKLLEKAMRFIRSALSGSSGDILYVHCYIC
ncbi:hypothetical protein ACFLSV_08735 [Bacteroidota bacterium]